MIDGAVERLNYIREHPQDFIDALMKHSYERLGQKLDIVREQKQMAFNQKNDLSFKYLTALEDLIGDVRIMKEDEVNWEKPKKKAINKRSKIVEEIFNVPDENEESESQDNNVEEKTTFEAEQLTFDF